MDSLGEDYSQEALAAIMRRNQPHAPKRKKSMNEKQERRMALLAGIQRKMRDRNSPAYTRWSKVFYAKQMANTLLYMSENNLDDADVFSGAAAASARCDELTERIQQAETRMRELTELRQHIFNYNKTRDVYRAYSQATFYRQFRDKYNLIAWSYTRDLEALLDQVKGDAQSWRQTLADAAAYYQQHKQYLANLLTHTTGYDSFMMNITAIHQRILLKTLERLSAPAPLDESIQIYSRIYCYGTVLFSCDWILGKYSLTEQELADIYENALPEQLARYIRNHE